MQPDTKDLRAPFPYFGGKSRVASIVWERFGDVPNYIEPFCGSLAVLLARPSDPRTETVNDADGWLVNFWRAIKADPEAVAEFADWPVSELDLHARGDWLFHRRGVGHWIELLRADPDFFDAKSAGWWVWGASAWIGTGWGPRQLPHLSGAQGVNRQLPHLSEGRGVNRQLPHLSEGRGVNRQLALIAYFSDLQDRLRETRVSCGDWQRITGPCVTTGIGTTAVFLDPPYGDGAMDYAAGGNKTGIAQEVAAWAIENGTNKELRIAYCGYEGCATFPESWECVPWKSRGGYGSQGDGEGRENAHRERIWFSPGCLRPDRPKQKTMFGETP